MKPTSLRTGSPLATGAFWPGMFGCAPKDALSPQRAAETMRRMFLTDGVARFSVSFVADAASRIKLVPSYLADDGRWVVASEKNSPTSQLRKAWTAIETGMVSDFGDRAHIVWTGIHHKRVSGQAYITVEGRRGARRFNIYGPAAMRRTVEGSWSINEGGDTSKKELPDANVFRIWTPHPDFPLLPYSPLWAGLDDLERLRLLNRTLERTASSQLLGRGLLWFPGEAMDDIEVADGVAAPRILRSYYTAAGQTMQEGLSNTSVEAVAPFAVWWDSDLGEPKLIRLGMPFDAHWASLRNAALEDWARSTDLPSVIVVNGGAGGGANHWSELLVDRRTFDMTIARDLDPFVKADLTKYVFRVLLADAELTAAEVARWRLDYDPVDLIVNQDRTLFAADALRWGIISVDAARRRLGFRDDEAASAADLAHVIAMSVRQGETVRRRREQLLSDFDGTGSQVNLPTA